MSASTETEWARAPAPARVPDFFIVGHPEERHLGAHADAPRAPQGVPADEGAAILRTRAALPASAPGAGKGTRKTLESYLALSCRAARRQRGRGDPVLPEAAGRIAAVAPRARIVAILREPASFLRSFHLQSVHNHVETQKSFRRAIELEPARRRGRRIPLLSQSPQTLLYSDHVRYTDQLRRFGEHFPAEQVLVLMMTTTVPITAGRCESLRFLDLEEPAGEPETVQTPTLPGLRSLTLHQIERAVKVAGGTPSPAVRRCGPLTLAAAEASQPALRAGLEESRVHATPATRRGADEHVAPPPAARGRERKRVSRARPRHAVGL